MTRLQVYSFLALAGLVLWLGFSLLKPFLAVLCLAMILAVIFYPVYRKLNKKWSEGVAAGLTIALILLIVIVPLYVFGQLSVNEILNAYRSYSGGGLSLSDSAVFQRLPISFQAQFLKLTQDLSSLVSQYAGSLAQTFTSILSNVASFMFSFFVLMFATFYFLKDGVRLKEYVMQISPIASSQENLLFSRLSQSVNGIVKGTFLVALIQGIVALIGFSIFHVPNPFLWAMATFLAAFIPNIGTALVVVPAVLFLFLVGETGYAIGMAIWGALAVGLVDNFISPRLIGRQAEMHPLLVLLSVIGGLQLFGVLGFILGPIAMAICVSVLSIYKDDVRLKVDSE